MSKEIEENAPVIVRRLCAIEGNPNATRGNKPPETLQGAYDRADAIVGFAKKLLKDNGIDRSYSLLNAVSEVINRSIRYHGNGETFGDDESLKSIEEYFKNTVRDIKENGKDFYPDGKVPARVFASAILHEGFSSLEEDGFSPKNIARSTKKLTVNATKIYSRYGKKLASAKPDEKLAALSLLLSDVRRDSQELQMADEVIRDFHTLQMEEASDTPHLELADETHIQETQQVREFGSPKLAFDNSAKIEEIEQELSHNTATVVYTGNATIDAEFSQANNGTDDFNDDHDPIDEPLEDTKQSIIEIMDKYVYVYAPIRHKLNPDNKMEASIIEHIDNMGLTISYIGKDMEPLNIPRLDIPDNLEEIRPNALQEDAVQQTVSKKEARRTENICSSMIAPEEEHDHILFE